MAETRRFAFQPDPDAAATARRAFAALCVDLGGALPPSAAIEHVGATSVAGCETNGDLDVCVRVDRADFRAADAALAARFDRHVSAVSNEKFAAFRDRARQPPLDIVLAVRGAPMDNFVRFRDCLRADPALVARYNVFKRDHDGAETEAFAAAKSEFIWTAILENAGFARRTG